jgi:hypothetical protein
MTSADGHYFLTGLAPGRYVLTYRDCGRGGAGAPQPGTPVMISGTGLVRLAPVTLRPATRSVRSVPSPPRRFTAAQVRGRASASRLGGIAGRVTNVAGHPLKNVCVSVNFRTGAVGLVTSKDGTYNTGKGFLPAGRYTVQFTASCYPGDPLSAGNLAPQWYKNKISAANADPVIIRAGKIARGISAVMRPGGTIAGLVRSRSGAKIAHVCVFLLSSDGKKFVSEATTNTAGSYRIPALDRGRYRVLFEPGCRRRSPYLPQWWPGAPSQRTSKLVRVRFATLTSHVDATLVLGGKITGVVRFKNRHGRPLRGICVSAEGRGALASTSFDASTGRNGGYVLEGMPTGSYSLSFGPGCNSNGNLLFQNYGHPVSVRAETTKVINAYLQPGGILAGRVTAAADGKPLGGICVGIGGLGDVTFTGSDGTYRMEQIRPGRYAVGFFGGCGNSGSYAPQYFRGRTRFVNAAGIRITGGKVSAGIDAAMKPGSTISGTVTSASGAKLGGICVGALNPGLARFLGDSFLLGDTISRKGSYNIANLAAGQYEVVFFSCGLSNYVPQWYRSAPNEGAASLLDVPAVTAVTGINAVLKPAGSIAGSVISKRGHPLSVVCITAINQRSGTSVQDVIFDQDQYVLSGLAPGRYKVRFDDCDGSGYASQWYSGKSSQRSANIVTVRARRTTRGIGAALSRGSGSISGRAIAKATGRPLAGICVVASSSATFAFAATDPAGKYTVKGLVSGGYHLFFSGCREGSRYARQERPGVVRVHSPGHVTGINAALVLGGSIAGTVLGGQPAKPQRGVCVDVVTADHGTFVDAAVTRKGGRYVMRDVPPGQYKVFFGDPACPVAPGGLAQQWYNAKHTSAAATVVAVRPGQATNRIDATLQRDGTISGTVTGPPPAANPLAGSCVTAMPLSGARPVIAVSQASGYKLTGLVPGRYLVEFRSGCGTSGYQTQWWKDAGSRTAATIVRVGPGTTRTGIDASLRAS